VTSGLSGTIEQTTSAPSAASAGDPTTRHPLSASRAGFRDDTVTSWPASTSRRTIGAPISPAPTNPTRMIASGPSIPGALNTPAERAILRLDDRAARLRRNRNLLRLHPCFRA
jgi:hypothetical protein